MRSEIRPLTAIRGLAALWVVAHHAQPGWAPGLDGLLGRALSLGYLAVDVFFVLSGFILAQVYRDLAPADVPRFLGRRLLRVYPLQLAVTAGLVGLALVSEYRGRALSHPWGDLPLSVAMLQALAPGTHSWNPPTWSVGAELICYALFPLAIPFLRRLSTAESAVLAGWLALAEWAVLTRHAGAIEGSGAVLRGLAGFALGMALSRLPRPRMRNVSTIGELFAVTGMAAAILVDRPPLLCVSAAALIWMLSSEAGLMARALCHPALVWLGAVSFSIYLLHAPLVGAISRIDLVHDAWARGAVLIVVLLPASGLTYRFIEQPGRRWRWRRMGRPHPA